MSTCMAGNDGNHDVVTVSLHVEYVQSFFVLEYRGASVKSPVVRGQAKAELERGT